ncbi:MAG: sulfotransferase, partial [Sphingomonas sp.]
PLAHVTIARLEDLLGHPGRAEAALADALACDANCVPALLALADLAERGNRVEELAALIGRLDASGVPGADIALLRARLACRRGDHAGALAAAYSAPAAFDPGRRAQIIGECSERLGDPAAAFEAFAEMNRVTAAEIADAPSAGAAYRATVSQRTALVTPEWAAGWAPAPVDDGREDPVFLFGFPRSGTTLLDTFLMGHPKALVMEERPALAAACAGLGDYDALADLSVAQIAAARARYFAEVDGFAPDAANRLVIDKLPLGMADTATVHRLFPKARFIFAERHPCDVVLSCFMTRFDPRGGMANFLDLGDAARLYDVALGHWSRCRDVLPLAVHTVRYERMVADAAGELAPLAAFLGLTLSDAMLDHRRTARERAHIATPSYAQVAEPLYTRALARWEKYRDRMAEVLPLLAPWADAMGYSCGERHLSATNVPEIAADR